jgi:CAAX prenyl protease-like protein
MWVALEAPARSVGLPADLAALPGWAAAGWLAVRALGACLVVPAAEELAFRGYLTRRLMGPRFERVSPRRWSWPAVVGSSVVFGLMHREWLAGTLAGLAFAAVYHRRGRLWDAVIAHATANAALLAWGAAIGDWHAWR